MNKKLQVFVSSTYTDLIEERQFAVKAILDAGHIPAGMELFKAGKSQSETIYKWIDDSDVYMLLLGGRYGSIEEKSGLSYTELEYNYALSKNMPVFAIILSDSFLVEKNNSSGKDSVFEKENTIKYNEFKNRVKTKIVKFADSSEQICTNIHSQLNSMLNDSEYSLAGWIKGDSASDDLLYTLPPNIISAGCKNKYLKFKDSDVNICPVCWYSNHKITPITIKYIDDFTCKVCGYSTK